MRVIFSVFQKNESDLVNNCNHFETMQDLTRQNIPFTVLEGCYKGVKELSFEIEANELDAEITDYPGKYNQESILVVDDNNIAALFFQGFKDAEHLGHWTRVDKTEALSHDAYSYYPVTDGYYIAK